MPIHRAQCGSFCLLFYEQLIFETNLDTLDISLCLYNEQVREMATQNSKIQKPLLDVNKVSTSLSSDK